MSIERPRLTILALAAAIAFPATAWSQAAAPAPPTKKVLRKLRLRFEREPQVREVQKAALQFFKVHPNIVARYRRGALWKAIVPEIEANFNWGRTDGDRRLVDAIYQRVFPVKDSEFTKNTNYTVGVRAHWYFDRLVFNAEVLDVTSLVGVQEGLLREITSLYFTRRRLITIFALNPPQNPGEQITESIRLDEITANIDALTGGFFGRELKRRKL